MRSEITSWVHLLIMWFIARLILCLPMKVHEKESMVLKSVNLTKLLFTSQVSSKILAGCHSLVYLMCSLRLEFPNLTETLIEDFAMINSGDQRSYSLVSYGHNFNSEQWFLRLMKLLQKYPHQLWLLCHHEWWWLGGCFIHHNLLPTYSFVTWYPVSV